MGIGTGPTPRNQGKYLLQVLSLMERKSLFWGVIRTGLALELVREGESC